MEDQQNQPGWAFKNEEGPGSETSPQPNSAPVGQQEPISWTASEFIENHKTPLWYVALFGGTFALVALLYFVFHDIISIIFIVIVSFLFASLGGRKPRQLPYTVDSKGITVAGKFYPYSLFKSFSVLREGAVSSVNLMPLKRFMPELSIYFALNDEDKIVAMLANNLPYEHREESMFDKMMKKLHF